MATSSLSATSDLATKPAAPSWLPPLIGNIDDTGLSFGDIADLALKLLYFQGQSSGYQIAKLMKLPFETVLRPIMDFLKREQLCEVRGAGGLGAGAYQYMITSKGADRAREKLERTTYTGPAPVPWAQYIDAMRAQNTTTTKVNEESMRRALADLVLEERIYGQVGAAVNSGKSIFLYGPPGNGKTTIAECVGRLILDNNIYIPYALDIDGQIVKLFDGINHVRVPVTEKPTTGALGERIDERWVLIKRPVVMVGGELTLEGLELSYDYINKYYEAPYQLKANGGMFLIDDFGRQQIRPRDLLNRWIVPMEKNVDFLSLHTGRKVEVPFEVLIVFSTNLPPRDLVDEAFLRRIRHKISITSPTFEAFREIFVKTCEARSIPFREEAVRYLLQEYYIKKKRKPRANHPRDLIEQITDIADYLNIEPTLSRQLLDQAASSYFVDL